jgi:hypothetical protein
MSSKKHTWMLVALFPKMAEIIALPGAPLDLETWLGRHARSWPFAFASGTRSTCQPAVRKIRLVKGAGEQ